MKKLMVVLICMSAVFILQNCSSSKKAAKAKEVVYSYDKDVAPILQASCTPCHFPPDGKKEPLNNYEAVKKNIDNMILFTSLPTTDNRFMPWKSKKPPLSDSLKNVLVQWKNQNMQP